MITKGVKAQSLKLYDEFLFVEQRRGSSHMITEIAINAPFVCVRCVRNGEEKRTWFNFDEIVAKVIG